MNGIRSRKWLAPLLAILLLLCGCGSGGAGTETGEQTAPAVETSGGALTEIPQESAPEQDGTYDRLIERFYALVSGPESAEDTGEAGETGVLENARWMGSTAPETMGYAIQDISGDGIPELIVGPLPEYSVWINAVYTLADGQPRLVLEGVSRSSYGYLGDGRFFYCGSGGASESGQGFFSLTEDGTALVCEEFLFTHPTEEDGSDIRVYSNTTGSWDPEASQETEMTLEAFWAMEPSFEALPMVPFSQYGAAPVRAMWAEDALTDGAGCETFAADDDPYAADVLFTAEWGVRNFTLVKLTAVEAAGSLAWSAETIYTREALTPEQPLVVRMSFPGDTPAYGISYTEEDGTSRRFTVEISGKDGSVLLSEGNWDLQGCAQVDS